MTWSIVIYTSVGQPCSSMRDQSQTIEVPGEGDDVEPLVDEQQLQPVPASEMRAISFLGALRIPVSLLNGISTAMCNKR